MPRLKFKSLFENMRLLSAFQQIITPAILSIWISSCQNPAPKPAPAALAVPEVATKPVATKSDILVLPFPEQFSMARPDLQHFSGSIDFENGGEQRDLRLLTVQENRFGCYSLDDSTKLWGTWGDCPNGVVCYTSRGNFQFGQFVFAPLYPPAAEYPPAIISAWKVRGDSLDFIAVLDKGFASDGWSTALKVSRMEPLQRGRYRLSGSIKWTIEQDGSRRDVSFPWSADWTPPAQLTFR